jgi:double-strand break repair protein MRE11
LSTVIAKSHLSHAHTQSGYLPENFLPEFLDLVVWGHEHECLIEPRLNPEMSFYVMQPGSSVATSLMPGEAVPKQVSIFKVAGKEFHHEPVLLKTVRPFVMKEIVLAEERALKNIWKKDNNRAEITRHLVSIVEELIEEARQQWRDAQDPGAETDDENIPLPLIRLRVEYTAPDGGRFDCENPQRFSNRFSAKVANINDVVQFHRKKATQRRRGANEPEMPEESVMEQLSLDSVKVEKLVREFLSAQSLGILPHKTFDEAVGDFVDKDDRHAMEMYVSGSLVEAIQHMHGNQNVDEENDDMDDALGETKSYLERLHEEGKGRRKMKSRKLKPKPDTWDSDLDGDWEDQPAALVHTQSEGEAEEDEEEAPSKGAPARGRGRGRGGRAAAATTRKTVAAPKKAAAAPRGRGKKKVVEEEDNDESDIQMVNIDEDEDEDEDEIFVKPSKTTARNPPTKVATRRVVSPAIKATPARRAAATTKQSTLNFSQSTQRATQPSRASKPIEIVSCSRINY